MLLENVLEPETPSAPGKFAQERFLRVVDRLLVRNQVGFFTEHTAATVVQAMMVLFLRSSWPGFFCRPLGLFLFK